MKKNLYLTFAAIAMLLTTALFSQSNPQNQVIVYFESGVERNPPANTTVTITSSNILNVLSNYGLSASNVIPSFPEFNESDIINWEIGGS